MAKTGFVFQSFDRRGPFTRKLVKLFGTDAFDHWDFFFGLRVQNRI